MYLAVTMAIIKGMLTPVDPGALRSGDAVSVTHQDETGKCFPPFSFLSHPNAVWFVEGQHLETRPAWFSLGRKDALWQTSQASGMSKKDSLNKIHS